MMNNTDGRKEEEASQTIRNYLPADARRLLRLWNAAGAAMGYAPLDEGRFKALLTEHPDFSGAYAFVLEEAGMVSGFASGCVPAGESRGYISCLILEERADTEENTFLLLGALEGAFLEAGCTCSAVSFFNPVRLPWILPGTEGRQHNNMPGAACDLPLYGRLKTAGYEETSRECAMYLDLAEFREPCQMERKAEKMAEEGYTVARFDRKTHTGLEEMVQALGNRQWSAEIPAAAEEGKELLVGLWDNVCAGFAGPIYPEETGRGYFAGIAVAPQYAHHGLGKLLFYRLLQREKETGAAYMSLFTGENNPAKQIYLSAGFRTVRSFAVMKKELHSKEDI